MKTILLGDFDSRTTDYLSELILEELREEGIIPSSFAFHLEVKYEEEDDEI